MAVPSGEVMGGVWSVERRVFYIHVPCEVRLRDVSEACIVVAFPTDVRSPSRPLCVVKAWRK